MYANEVQNHELNMNLQYMQNLDNNQYIHDNNNIGSSHVNNQED